MSELRGFQTKRPGEDVRWLREYDRVKAEIDNALMSSNLMISRAQSDLDKAVKRKRQLLERTDCLYQAYEQLYWIRLLTWATTGRVV